MIRTWHQSSSPNCGLNQTLPTLESSKLSNSICVGKCCVTDSFCHMFLFCFLSLSSVPTLLLPDSSVKFQSPTHIQFSCVDPNVMVCFVHDPGRRFWTRNFKDRWTKNTKKDVQSQNAVRIFQSDNLFRAESTVLSVITPHFLRQHLIKRVKKRGELSLRSNSILTGYEQESLNCKKNVGKFVIIFIELIDICQTSSWFKKNLFPCDIWMIISNQRKSMAQVRQNLVGIPGGF